MRSYRKREYSLLNVSFNLANSPQEKIPPLMCGYRTGSCQCVGNTVFEKNLGKKQEFSKCDV